MRYLAMLATAMTLLLAGCATTIRSDVTAFHEWPAELQDKSYVFQQAAPEHDTLEYRNYLNLVRGQLAQLGFREVDQSGAAKLKVAMNFSTTDLPTRVVQSADPFWTGPGYWGGRYGSPWGYRGWYGYRSPFYDPFLYGPVMMEESVRHNFERTLRVTIDGADGRKLFDVTVHNSSRKAATPAVMPALVTSAFAGFPGQSGVPHRVDLQVQ